MIKPQPIKKTQTIFILEDDPDIREATAMTLNKTLEYTVLSSASSADAFFRIKNQKFDCIILDYHIGKTETAQGLIEYIRTKCEFNKTTPIILMTGGIGKEVFFKLKTRLNTVLVKPVPNDELIARVKKVTAIEE